jgi:hypothetical protein
MFTAIIGLLGGATARLVLGQLFDFVNRWQESKNQIAMMQAQAQIDAAKSQQQISLLQLQSSLGIKEIEAQVDAHSAATDDDSFLQAVKNTAVTVGVKWVDAWNSMIRPTLATVCIGLWCWSLWERKFVMTDWDLNMISTALGIFIGGRIHATGR